MATSIKIPSIFSAVDKMSAPIMKMGAGIKKFADVSQENIARIERQFRSLKNNAQTIAKNSFIGGLALATPLLLATKSAIDFEAKMSNISTIVDTSKESITDMGNEVLKMSTKLPVSIDDLTTSLYDIRSAGINASSAMSVLESSSKLAVAGLSTASEATDIMTSSINAFASENLSANQISDILFKTVKYGKTTVSQLSNAFGSTAPIVQSANISLADFSAATAALTTLGTPASVAQNQIRAAVVGLQKPTKEMSKIYKELGVTSEKELIKKEGGMVGAFMAISKAGSKMNIKLTDAFGSVEALGAVTALTGSVNSKYTETLKDMTAGTNAVNEAFDKQSKTGKSAMQIAKNNMETFSITIGTVLIPVLSEVVQMITPLIQNFVEWTKKNPGLLSTIVKLTLGISGLLFLISGISSAVAAFSTIMTLFTSVTKVVTAAQWLWNAAMSANPIGLIIIAVAALIALIAIVVSKWNDWGAALSIFLGPLGLIISLIQSFRRNWEMIKEAFKTGGIIAGLKAIGATILDAILMPLQQLLELMSNIPGIGDLAGAGAKGIESLRQNLGVNTTTDESGQPLNSKAVTEEIKTTREQNTNINGKGVLTIKNNTENDASYSGNIPNMKVLLSSTQGAF